MRARWLRASRSLPSGSEGTLRIAVDCHRLLLSATDRRRRPREVRGAVLPLAACSVTPGGKHPVRPPRTSRFERAGTTPVLCVRVGAMRRAGQLAGAPLPLRHSLDTGCTAGPPPLDAPRLFAAWTIPSPRRRPDSPRRPPTYRPPACAHHAWQVRCRGLKALPRLSLRCASSLLMAWPYTRSSLLRMVAVSE